MERCNCESNNYAVRKVREPRDLKAHSLSVDCRHGDIASALHCRQSCHSAPTGGLHLTEIKDRHARNDEFHQCGEYGSGHT